MSAFAQWYLAVLKSHPMAANASTAVLLMSAGDVMAQGIESSHKHLKPEQQPQHSKVSVSEAAKPSIVAKSLDQALLSSASTSAASFVQQQQRKPTLGLSRHATLSPHLEVAHCDYGITRLEWERPTAVSVLDATLPDCWRRAAEAAITTTMSLPLDGVRTGTMAFWAGAVQAPFFLMLYRAYDRILPTAITPYAVGSRVMLSFVSTIPFTAAFFGYGTLMHHLLYSSDDNDESNNKALTLRDNENDESEDYESLMTFWDTVGDQIKEKWANDLGSTLQTSATVWVPFNALNFSLIPPHLRPLCMMGMSACWNCYLSLVQHAR